jgi:hypothetical protein
MTHTTDDARNPDVSHERTDVVIGPVVKFVAGLAAAIVVTCVAMWILLGRLEATRTKADPPRAPLAPEASIDKLPRQRVQAFPKPRLETDPALAGERARAREAALLSGYGWVDRPGGVVRIPIERAIDLTLERGLPVRPQAAAAASTAEARP